MTLRIAQLTVTVRDYDEAIAFYVGKLGFELLEDRDLGSGKRWVRVRPPGSAGTQILLARAVDESQLASVGSQCGGRVFAFLETDDFARDYRAMVERGVEFVRAPSQERYGTVAVFADLYGNRFDLIERSEPWRDELALAPPAPVEHRLQALDENDEFVVQRVDYRGDEDDPISAHLFLPRRAAPLAAVVVHHQNNSEFHLGKSEVSGFAGAPLQAFAPALARRGIAVLAPDILTFEERRKSGRGREPHARDWLEHYNEMAHRLLRGELLMRKLLSDALRALTVLASRPEVDAARVGVLGHSMGGILALHHAAVDERVAFACASGAVSSLAARIEHGVGIGMAQVIPGAAARWPAHRILAAAARRPFLVVSSDDDPYAIDSGEVVRRARETAPTVDHFHAGSGHALDRQRFDAMVEWITSRAGGAGP